jgi:hypothetical protein
MHALADSLAKVEQDLLREAEPKRMGALAEDESIDLHKRIRRARNKYAGIYRRQGSSKVSKKGGRGLAMEKNARNAGRSEVFEDTLARVSAQLAEVASEAAEQLKAERLAAANPAGTWPGAQGPRRPMATSRLLLRSLTAPPRARAGRSAMPPARPRERGDRPSATTASPVTGPSAGGRAGRENRVELYASFLKLAPLLLS